MIKITVQVEGMMCAHCEAHVNGAVSKAFAVEKVSSDHSKNRTVILVKEDIDDAKIREVISAAGYKPGEIKRKKALPVFVK